MSVIMVIIYLPYFLIVLPTYCSISRST